MQIEKEVWRRWNKNFHVIVYITRAKNRKRCAGLFEVLISRLIFVVKLILDCCQVKASVHLLCTIYCLNRFHVSLSSAHNFLALVMAAAAAFYNKKKCYQQIFLLFYFNGTTIFLFQKRIASLLESVTSQSLFLLDLECVLV